MEQVSENHKAVVVCLKEIRPHSNADRLRLVTIFGNQVVIGLKEQEGDLGLYFNSDLRISQEFGKANDLFRRKDEAGNNAGGMFDENGKVRCQKFRKEQSDGFFIPLNSLEFTGGKIDSLKEGDSFQEFNGVKICEKYVVPSKSVQNGPTKKTKKYDSIMFPKHIDTSHLMKHLGDIGNGDRIVITEKLHGTSQRYGHVLIDRNLTFFEKIAQKLGLNVSTQEWIYLNGTRNVVLTPEKDRSNEFHDPAMRDLAVMDFKGNLRKGEVVYFEVVGYEPSGTTIMPSVDTSKMKDKKFTKKYANHEDKKTMIYKYGCQPGEFRIYVYRIAITTPDGHQYDLPWNDIKARCNELGVEHVPEIFDGTVEECIGQTTDFCFDEYKEQFSTEIERLSAGHEILDHSHLREGVCVRVESKLEDITIYKHKSFEFKVMEDLEKASGVENMEEQS